jgi:RHS repeat-associated protein
VFSSVGTYTLTAASTGLTSATSNSFAIGSGAASKLAFTTQPVNGTVGNSLANVVVQVQDANGNLVTSSTASITMTSTPTGVGGTTTVPAVNGVATFGNLVFTSANNYTLTASSLGLINATSNSFKVAAGTPVIISVSPNSGQQGQQNLSVAITGQFTHFAQGASVANFGTGVRVNSLTVSSATTATAVLNIDPSANAGIKLNFFPNTDYNANTAAMDQALGTTGYTIGSFETPALIPGLAIQLSGGVPTTTWTSLPNLLDGDVCPGLTSDQAWDGTNTASNQIVNQISNCNSDPNLAKITTFNYASGATSFGIGLSNFQSVNPQSPLFPVTNHELFVNGVDMGVLETLAGTAWSPGLTRNVYLRIDGTNGGVIRSVGFEDLTDTSVRDFLMFDHLAILPAPTGARDVTVTTNSEVATLADGFTVNSNPPAPAIVSVNPGGGQQGQQSLSVALSGQFTNWVHGTTTASFGTGVTVVSLAVDSATTATAVINISATAVLGPRPVTMTTGSEIATLSNGFTVAPFQSIASRLVFSTQPVNGTAGNPLANVVVQVQDTTGNVVTSSNASITISSTPTGVGGTTTVAAVGGVATFSNLVFTATGSYTLTAASSGLTSATSNSFTISAGTASKLVFTTPPTNGTEGSPLAAVVVKVEDAGGNVVTGSTASITISSTPTGVGGTTTVAAVGGVATFSNLVFTATGSYTLTAASSGLTSATSNSFNIASSGGSPALLMVSPGFGLQGQSVTVTITAQNTHFVQGTTRANFGPGIAVGTGTSGSFGPVTVTSSTTATAQLAIAGNAAFGPRTVAASTGAEQASLINGFSVNGNPTILYVTPNYAKPGTSVTVTIQGQFTHFAQGTSVANFGAGISVGGATAGANGPITVTSATTATAQLTISSSAALGPRAPITVTTGAETASWTSPGFFVLGNVTGSAPTVSITSPTEGATVTTLTTATGTVSSPNLAYWTLSYQGSGSTQFTQFATGTNTGTVTGTFDPTLLLNGITTIQLTGIDQSGQASTTIVHVSVVGAVKIGNFKLAFTDLNIPVAGIPINVVRTYDSRVKSSGDFGFGWSLSYNTVRVETSDILGNNWTTNVTSGQLGLPNYCVQPGQNYIVSIRLQDGRVYQFTPSATSATQCALVQPPVSVDLQFTPTGSTPPNAALSEPNSTGLLLSTPGGGPTQLLDGNLDVYGTAGDDDIWTLTLENGQVLQLSMTLGLQSIMDPNGNTLTFTSGGITSAPSGKSVTFARDSQNRVTSITDPNGNVLHYTYTGAGDLATFTDALRNVSTFSYDNNHDLISYLDASGNQPIRSVYDDSGRLIQIIDAFGHITNLSHNPGANTETITDPLGHQTILVYDANGNVISTTDPIGNVTTSTYDANNNLLTETDPLGHATTFTYDVNNNRLTQTDTLGHTIGQTYDAKGHILTLKDQNGNTRTNTYDGNGNLLSTKDALGNATSWTYDSQGNRTSMTDAFGKTSTYTYDAAGDLASAKDAAGNVTNFSYDANGNRTSQTDPKGNVTGFAYDASNNLTSTTNPDGTSSTRTFNATGLRTSDTDELRRTTAYVYDAEGHVTQIQYSDGTAVGAAYDATGRRTQLTTRSGATTSFSYDAAGRAVSTQNSATGATTQTVYDAAGNVRSLTDPLGHTTQYVYDAANRRTSISDALNHTMTYTYDAAGNVQGVTDANGHTINHQFDALNRPVSTKYPDGTTVQVTYDAVGKVISKTDSAGKVTQYAYDSLSRLISVTDALGHTTTYTYDALGNRATQTDANGHTTTFTYDSRSRRIARELPAGQTESFVYDAVGNVTKHTDFNGKVTTYTYDSSNHVLTKTPDASFGAPEVTYTYLPSGLRSSMTDTSGVTTYSYDSADRITQIVKPAGTLSYTYDAMGNVISITTSKGTIVDYAYDQANRLASVSEASTGTTTYSYDNVNNLSSTQYGNGVSQNLTYNSKNQVLSLVTMKGSSTLASYAYTLDAVGHRLSVAELSGRLVAYTYDAAYRMTSETVSGAPVGPNGAVSYTYDPVGNRTQLTSTLAGIASQASTYDADDRLTSDAYDANGNTTLSGGTTNGYDFENHLKQHGAVTIVYDGDGNRASKTVGGVTTKYLVDEKNPTGFPQVVEESVSDGSTRTLVYGLQRICQRQFVASTSSTLTSYFVYDGHGSVRALTNSAGAVTDTYDYDAFGNMIHSTGSTPNEFLFAGEQFDSDLGNYYNRARYLKTSTGRFLTMDAIDGDPETPITLHKYLFANADPVDVTDPTGNEGDLGDIAVSLAISSTLDSIATFALNSPLGSSVLGFVASHLMPPGYFDALKTLKPDAGLVGGSISFNAKIPKVPFGVTAGGGLELLVGTGTGKTALYGYYGGGISFGATANSVGWSGYAGVVYNSPTSSGYLGNFITLSVPFAVIQGALRSKMQTDWQLAEMSVASAIVYLPNQVVWIVVTELQFVQVPLPTSNVSVNLFSDPGNRSVIAGGTLQGSLGFSVAYGKSFTANSTSNIALTWTYYWQLAPPWSFPISPCDGDFAGCGAGQDVPFR